MSEVQYLFFLLWMTGATIGMLVYTAFLASPLHTKKQKICGGIVLVVLATVIFLVIYHLPKLEILNKEISDLQSMLLFFWFFGVLAGIGQFLYIALEGRNTAIEKLGLGVVTVGIAVLVFFLIYDLPNMPIMKG